MDIEHTYWDMIKDHFDGDTEKTRLWFETSNPMLGNISPIAMIYIGREDKLLKCMVNALNGN